MRWESRTDQGRMHVNPPGLLGYASLKTGGLPCPKSPPARWGTRANPAGILAPALGRLRKPFRLRRKGFCPSSDPIGCGRSPEHQTVSSRDSPPDFVPLLVPRLDLIASNHGMVDRWTAFDWGFDRPLKTIALPLDYLNSFSTLPINVLDRRCSSCWAANCSA